MLRIAFAGTPEFALPALRALACCRHTLAGVLTQPDRPAGRGRALRTSPVKALALELGVPVAQPARLSSVEDRSALAQWAVDLLVVVAYGLLLPRAALELPRLGCLNIHASLLPRWRGAAPIARAILAGDRHTGVTIMQLDEGLDTGPMLAQRRIEIAPDASAGQLQSQLAMLGAQLLLESLDAIEAGSAVAQPQPSQGVTYAHKLDKREARIDWTGNAELIARQVRAFDPWPVAETRWRGQRLRIWQAQARAGCGAQAASGAAGQPGDVTGLSDEALDVRCGQGVLAVRRLQLEGRRVLPADEFVRGQPLIGERFD